jgi:hypothetical protein
LDHAAETKLRLSQNRKLNHSAGSRWSEDQCGLVHTVPPQSAARANSDSKWNDSVWAQLSDAVDQNGSATYRIGTEGIVGEPRKLQQLRRRRLGLAGAYVVA